MREEIRIVLKYRKTERKEERLILKVYKYMRLCVCVCVCVVPWIFCYFPVQMLMLLRADPCHYGQRRSALSRGDNGANGIATAF